MAEPRTCSCCGKRLVFGRGDHVRRNGGYQCVMCFQNGGRRPAGGRAPLRAFIEEAAKQQAEEKKPKREKPAAAPVEPARPADIGHEDFEVEVDSDLIAG